MYSHDELVEHKFFLDIRKYTTFILFLVRVSYMYTANGYKPKSKVYIIW